MPMVTDGNAFVAPARVSTPAPFNVPRWENPLGVPEPDLSQLIEMTGGTWTPAPEPVVKEATQELNALGLDSKEKMSLGTLGLSKMELGKTEDWRPKAAPTYTPGKVQNVGGTAPSGSGGTKSGGLGLSAYGFTGNSGQASQRGSAAFGFQPPMWAALQAANAAMKAAGLGTFGITDGWRSYDAQVALKAKKPTLAATPGRSVHGVGLAADLRLSNKQLQWLYKNGKNYGLVNLPSESWHWQMSPSLWK